MKVLLDHCVPKQLGFLLTGHYVRTTHFMKWDALENGELLTAGAAEFDVFVTVDQGLPAQQNRSDLPIPVIAPVAVSNELEDLAPLVPEVLRLLGTKLQKRVYVVDPPTQQSGT